MLAGFALCVPSLPDEWSTATPRDTSRSSRAPSRPGKRGRQTHAVPLRLTPMRTYVRMMGLGPYRPLRDLEHALERGQLKMAVAAAKDVSHEYGRPIGLDVALRFLPLVAAQQLDAYDGWACRWLARWLNETPGVTAEQAAEVAASLAGLPGEPAAFETLRGSVAV